MDFDTFLQKLLNNPSSETTIRIKGKEKNISGMARFEVENYPGLEYIKIVFNDHSFLLIMIDDKEFYYADAVIGLAQGITDEEIGEKTTLEYNGKTYALENKNDYQYVLQRYVGSYQDIEGEARFSDYFPVEGPKEFLSLGWLSRTGKRADINPIIIAISEVELI